MCLIKQTSKIFLLLTSLMPLDNCRSCMSNRKRSWPFTSLQKLMESHEEKDLLFFNPWFCHKILILQVKSTSCKYLLPCLCSLSSAKNLPIVYFETKMTQTRTQCCVSFSPQTLHMGIL